MKIMVPLSPDIQKKKLRTIEAEMPDDTTQEEFWNFVLLTSTQLFGEKRGDTFSWNIADSFQHHFKKYFPSDDLEI